MNITTSICGSIIDFRIENDFLATCVKTLLEKNIVSSKNNTNPFLVNIICEHENANDETNYIAQIRTKKASVFFNSNNAICYVDEDKIKSAESLYYQLISPLIIKIMEFKGLLYIHGAAMNIDRKGFAVIGPRNAGKTTLSLITLLQGEEILTDDCLFINNLLEAQSFYRPLHVNPNLGAILNIEDRLKNCKPYLHDEIELNYDIDLYHPNQMITKLKLESVFFSQVKNIPSTSVKELADDQKKNKLFTYINENGGLSSNTENVIEAMLGLPMYDLLLGNDILSNPQTIKNLAKY